MLLLSPLSVQMDCMREYCLRGLDRAIVRTHVRSKCISIPACLGDTLVDFLFLTRFRRPTVSTCIDNMRVHNALCGGVVRCTQGQA